MLSESATARFEIPFRTKPEEFRRRVLERDPQGAGGGRRILKPGRELKKSRRT